MILAVASGKGGTGKTTVATSLALSLAPDHKIRFLDCDVEAPNAHIMLHPDLTETKTVSLPIPEIDESSCTLCRRCAEVCQYNAIVVAGEKVLVFPDICHGCGSCTLNCPENAIHEVPYSLGIIESGATPEGISFSRGLLNIGQPLGVPIIKDLKNSITHDTDHLTIIDAPPGSSCPVVEVMRDTDFVLLVTEPTPFGLHDLKLAYEVASMMGIPVGVILNRDGIGDSSIEIFCAEKNIPLLMRIPLKKEIGAGLAQGKTLISIQPEYKKTFIKLYSQIKNIVEETR